MQIENSYDFIGILGALLAFSSTHGVVTPQGKMNMGLRKGLNITAELKWSSMIRVVAQWILPILFVFAITVNPTRAAVSPPSARPNTQLLDAVLKQDLNATLSALKSGANPNLKTRFGVQDPLLLKAITLGDRDIVRALLAAGANAEATDGRGTPILVAATSLVESGEKYYPTILCIKTLVEDGKANVHAMDSAYIGDDRTALHQAAANGVLPLVKILYRNGANLEIKNHHDETPIFFAAENGHLNVVRYLVRMGANPVALSKQTRRTPLMAAASGGFDRIVSYLLKFDQKAIARKDRFGKTPLDLAKSAKDRFPADTGDRNYEETIQLLENTVSKMAI